MNPIFLHLSSFGLFACFFSLFLKLHLNRHDVVVHVESVANGEIALGVDFHSHPLVEPDGAVVAVYVQVEAAGRRMLTLYVTDGRLKELLPDAFSLSGREYIDLLEVIHIVRLLLYRDIPHRFVAVVGEKVHVSLVGNLSVQTVAAVHPLHHVFQLLWTEDAAIGGREDFFCQPADDGNIVEGSGADGQINRLTN